jgi:hypothetical protein
MAMRDLSTGLFLSTDGIYGVQVVFEGAKPITGALPHTVKIFCIDGL